MVTVPRAVEQIVAAVLPAAEQSDIFHGEKLDGS